MNTSAFDSGGRTRQGLPLIPDTIEYLKHFLGENPNEIFTRKELFEWVALEFNIPATNQEAEGETIKPLFHSQMDYILTDGVLGDREEHTPESPRIGEPWLKRVGYGEYQHISGPIPIYKPGEEKAINLFHEALAFFKHARKLEFSPQQAKDMVADKWNIETRERAASVAFA